MVAANKGYRLIVVVDHHAAVDKINIMKAYGATIVCVGDSGEGIVAVQQREQLAKEICARTPGSFFVNQADNPDNPSGYQGLAAEILALGSLTDVIGAIGTGGSLCGVARVLKSAAPGIRVVAVEPLGSIIFGGPAGLYYQSGTGNPVDADIPHNVDYTVIDEYYKVSDREAFNTARVLAREVGVLLGGSAGGVLYSALRYLDAHVSDTRTLMAIMADGGEKYLSTIFNDEWMQSRDLVDLQVEEEIRRWLDLDPR